MKLPPDCTSEAGTGNWRLIHDEDGNVVAFELWAWDPKMRGKIKTYKAFKIVKIS